MIIFRVIGKKLKAHFPEFIITNQPPPDVVINLSDLLGFTVGATYYRNYTNFSRETRTIMYKAALSILDSGAIPQVTHPGILRRMEIAVVRPGPMALQLQFNTRPKNHRDERALEASIAAATLAYTGFALGHPLIDRTLVDYALTALVEEYPDDKTEDWLSPRHAVFAQQYVLDKLAEILKTRLS